MARADADKNFNAGVLAHRTVKTRRLAEFRRTPYELLPRYVSRDAFWSPYGCV